jgi:hypothetical protein
MTVIDPAPAEIMAPITELFPVLQDLGYPISTARLWTEALVPRGDGGWNWIGQFYAYPELCSAQWVVRNLETGSFTVSADATWATPTQGRYANSNFTSKNQLRAPNGRVFFPAIGAWLFYYDPIDEQVHDLGSVPGAADALAYSMIFNHDGSMLYGGTLAMDGDRRPAVFTVNPSTLAVELLCRCGTTRTKNGYAYYLRADGDWLYVLVGEEKWELVAVHVPTKASKLLATEEMNAWAYFVLKPGGLTVQLVKNNNMPGEVVRQWWLINGELEQYVENAAPPGGPRDLTPYTNPLVMPPQIDKTEAPEVLRSRPFGANGAWTEHRFSVHTAPIAIESLLALPDNSVLGEVTQYGGHFRYANGATSRSNHGTGLGNSNAALVVGSKAYLSGYPNGVLLEYDPAQPFADANPKKLGSYSDGLTFSGVKRSTVLAHGNDRLYMAGLRDRVAFGAGVGYYDLSTHAFAGHFTGLEHYTEGLGLVVLGSRVVLGGTLGTNPLAGPTPTEAQLVIYDQDLVELARQTPLSGSLDSGRLFACSSPHVVVGMTADVLYRWDIFAGQMLQRVSFSGLGPVKSASQGPAGIVAVMGSTLVLVDPDTLQVRVRGTVPAVRHVVQSGVDVYASKGAALVVFSGVLA